MKMRLFSKNAPTKCPKCGKSDGWRCVTDDTVQSNAANAGLGNPFYLDSQRDPFYEATGNRQGPNKVRYRYLCDNCGYERTY